MEDTNGVDQNGIVFWLQIANASLIVITPNKKRGPKAQKIFWALWTLGFMSVRRYVLLGYNKYLGNVPEIIRILY